MINFMDLFKINLSEAISGLKEKKYSSAELVSSCLNRANSLDGKVKSFVTLCDEKSLIMAKQADEEISKNSDIYLEKPLLGIPIAVKDNFLTSGIKTTASSKILENYIPPYDATVVAKLKEAGAIIIGKTNMDAWAHGSSTETSQFFTTRNPWNLDRLPGGSSGGSAAAIAADFAIGSVGSETAGSIRQPASWCGVTGLKPSYGVVSRYGVVAMASSTDSPGPITKTVSDSKLIFEILKGKDENDATSVNFVPCYAKKINELTIGVPKEYFSDNIQKEIKEAVLKAIDILNTLGIKVKEISLLDPKYSIAVYTILQRAEVSSNLARYDGIRFGNGRTFFGDEAKRRIMLGTHVLSAGYYDAYYLNAQKARTLVCNDFDRAFREVDLIISPSTPCTALPLGASKDSAMFGELQDVLVEASSIAGLPGLNVPCGFDGIGLPIGMQIVGPRFSEETILELGQKYQQLTEWHLKRPEIL